MVCDHLYRFCSSQSPPRAQRMLIGVQCRVVHVHSHAELTNSTTQQSPAEVHYCEHTIKSSFSAHYMIRTVTLLSSFAFDAQRIDALKCIDYYHNQTVDTLKMEPVCKCDLSINHAHTASSIVSLFAWPSSLTMCRCHVQLFSF
eukprot:2419843-Pleurochrysis_carterae.AAC.5